MRVLLPVLALLAVAAATPRPIHIDWTEVSPPAGDEFMRITLFLHHSQDQVDLLSKKVDLVSNPSSPYYTQYMSVPEIAAVIGSSNAVINDVTGWLTAQGAVSVDVKDSKDAVVALMRVSAVSDAFAVRMWSFQHKYHNGVVHRSFDTPAMPAALVGKVDLVHGLAPPAPTSSSMRRAKLRTDGTGREVQVPEVTGPLAANTPIDGVAMSRGGASMTVSFGIMCASGSTATNPNNPCGMKTGAMFVAISGSSAKTTPAAPRTFSTCVPFTCASSPQTAPVMCSATTPTDLYIPYTYTISLSDASSCTVNSDAAFTMSYPSVATPPVSVRMLAEAYNIPQSVTGKLSGSASVVEFEQQYYSPADLDLFLRSQGLSTNVSVNVIGPNNPSIVGVEADLDIQWLLGIAPGINMTFWSIAANSTVEVDDILSWAEAMMANSDPPLISSLSYGMTEMHVDEYLGQGYLARSEVALKALAARGLTVIIADGDTGAGDLGAPPMSFATCSTLHADWPSNSPSVLAIGSTYFTPFSDPICFYPEGQGMDCAQQPVGEVTTSLDYGLFWTSGGGFSQITARPSYQEEVVQRYLDLNATQHVLPPAEMFNASGRGYGDAVAVGHNLMVAAGNKIIPVDGTSASAPIFAGVLTLLNSARLEAGGKPLGFMNPLLYSIGAKANGAFRDVTVGINKSGSYGFSPVTCSDGFRAAPGWDAASGFGSPNYEVMLQEVLQAMPKQKTPVTVKTTQLQ